MLASSGSGSAGRGVPRRVRLVAQDGSEVWIREESKVVTGDDGQALYTQGYLEDVTERRAAERELATSERRLRMVTDNMNDVIFVYGMDRKLRYVTPSFEELTGFTVAELFERNFLNDVHPRTTRPGCCRCGGGVRGRGVHRRGVPDHQPRRPREVVLERRLAGAGRRRGADRRADPRRRHHGPKRAELRLRESEERSRLIDRHHRATHSWRLDVEAWRWSGTGLTSEMFGFDRDEVIGRDIVDAGARRGEPRGDGARARPGGRRRA